MRWNFITYIVLSVAILVLAVVLYLSLANLNQLTRETRAQFRANMTWDTAQIETELFVVLEVLESYHAADDSVTHDDVVERFDIFWSRVEGAQKGAVGEILMSYDGAREAIEQTMDALVAVEPDIMSLERGDEAAFQRIKNRLRVLRTGLHEMTLEASHAQNLMNTQEYRYIDDTHSTIMLIFGGVLAGGSLLIVLILFEHRKVIVLQSTLEQQVEERTRQLQRENVERRKAEEQLRQAQRMEAVGQLTGGVAHDFNNLLAVIMGNAELLEDRLGREDAKLSSIFRAATRGAELTQRLLAFSRRQPLRPRAIDLGGLVSGMSEMLTRTLRETIEVGIATTPDLWTALADPGQVENAILNLALNARDAMPNGGKLTIECANVQLDDAYVADNPEAKAGDYVVLAVSDSGSGMSAEVLEHAFEPFFTTKGVGEGSGLGLSMVYGFAQQSGGHATLYSEAGRGTTAKLYLPRAEAAMQSGEVSREAGIPRGRGEAILVIEDDPEVLALAARMLESLGYRVIDVADAAGAHKVLAAGKPVDLVLSDVVLPGGVSGPEFAEEARAAYPGLKVIFMSGYAAAAAKRNGFLGSDQVLLNKPFHRRELAKVIREALG